MKPITITNIEIRNREEGSYFIISIETDKGQREIETELIHLDLTDTRSRRSALQSIITKIVGNIITYHFFPEDRPIYERDEKGKFQFQGYPK